MNNIRKILTIALVDAIASQFYMGFMVEGFRITLSVVLFPVLLYFYDELNPIKTSIITGIIGIFARSMFMFFEVGNLNYSINHSFQEIGFYIIYGLLYYFIYYISCNKNLVRWYVTIWACDFISNFGEVLIRTNFKIDKNALILLRALIGIAIIRSVISIIIIYFMKRYKMLIVKEKHEERYRKLVSLAEELNSETYFMKKNLDYLEKVMSNAYTLYERIPQEDNFAELKNISLNISKDVHEIKKEYLNVIKGIEEITNSTIEYSYIDLKDIIIILRESTIKYLKSENIDIELDFRIESNFNIKNHYSFMSIIRNLVNNSIEALIDKEGKKIINLKHCEFEDNHMFIISDNGNGIKEKDLKYIFEPGFSTKFNKTTGDIKRGIGLTLVKSIVEDDFKGTLNIFSEYKKGTCIEIKIPKDILEGNK